MYHGRGSSARLRLACGDFRGELGSVSRLSVTERRGECCTHTHIGRERNNGGKETEKRGKREEEETMQLK